MQKGFVSLELMLIVLTFALLATVAVPNAVALVDRAALDYEQKRLYSELQYVRTLNRSAQIPETGVKDFISYQRIPNGKEVMMELDRNANSYRILRDEKPLRETHYLSNGVTFSEYEGYFPKRIWFDTEGSSKFEPPKNNSVTIVLKSRRGETLTIVFDSVGRIRGDNKDE